MRGGKRNGSGRRVGSGRYGEPTQLLRVPQSLIPTILDLLSKHAALQDAVEERSFELGQAQSSSDLKERSVTILPPQEAEQVLTNLATNNLAAAVVILDPWYSTSPQKYRARSHRELIHLIHLAGQIADHVFIWGWPVDLAPLVERIPKPLRFRAWLTWHHKNVPSRTRGWRPAQQACLHLSQPGATLYPENFKTGSDNGMYRYACSDVIEAGALVGFAGRSQSTGHPAQKPEAVIEPLLLMTTQPNELVIDPMAGSGTTGAVARKLGRKAILNDRSEIYTCMMEKRLAQGRTTPEM